MEKRSRVFRQATSSVGAFWLCTSPGWSGTAANRSYKIDMSERFAQAYSV